MRKLSKLREWLTLDEAVIDISNVLDERFTLADLYQLSLDGHLVLSVNFVNTVKAKKITLIKRKDIKHQKKIIKNFPGMPEGACIDVPINVKYPISWEYWIESIEDKVESLSGVWDLSMFGTEKFSIKQLYLNEISSDIEVKVPEFLNVYVKRDEGTYQLQLLLSMEQYRERYNNQTVNGLRARILDSALAYPASRLDEVDHVLVVKVKEVTRFIKSLKGKPKYVKPPVQRPHTKNNDKQSDNKAKTQARNANWQREAIKLKGVNRNKSMRWVSIQISKLPISEGKSPETIRRNIKI